MASSANSSGRQHIPVANKYDRIVVLVDMDCFFCQVEERKNPALRGKPLAVVQYNAWRGGGIIAVNYAARAKGVTRHMRGEDAQRCCPDIVLVKVPNLREKADLSKYRDAGKEVANVLQRFTSLMERASVDEAYLDITEKVNQRLEAMTSGTYMLKPEKLLNTYAVGYENFGDYVNRITARFVDPMHDGDDDEEKYADVHDVRDVSMIRQSDLRLLLGASIAGEIRAAVKAETSYECSAGIAHNKILAKLTCGINKPNKQTLLPLNQVPKLFDTLPVGKITGLGGKFGEEVCERLKIRFIGQLLRFTNVELQKKFNEKNGMWLYNICRGIDLEAVTPRFYSKSIGCCKKFPGRNNITGLNTLRHWLTELAKEICDRLEKDLAENNRRARQMVVSYVQNIDDEEVASSRSTPLVQYNAETIVRTSIDLIKANTKQFFRTGSEMALNNEIRFLGISVGKFETINCAQGKIEEMFANQAAKKRRIETDEIASVDEATTSTAIKKKSNDNGKAKDGSVKSFFLKALSKQTSDASSAKTSTESDSEIFNDPSTSADAQNLGQKSQDSRDSPKELLSKDKSQVCNHESKEHDPKVTDLMQMNQSQIVASKSKSFFHKLLSEQQFQSEISGAELINNNLARVLNDEQVPVAHDDSQLPADSEQKRNGEVQIVAQDYTTAYAEYAIPELHPDLLQFLICDICHEKVPADERSQQMHQDTHIAQQLSQQQRIEYREEIKNRIAQNKKTQPQKAGKKTKTPPTKGIKSVEITKFLKPKVTTSLDLSVNCDLTENGEMVVCTFCHAPVQQSDLQEHTDHHAAQELHEQLNRTSLIVHAKKNHNGIATKSIANYFSQPKA